MTNGPVDSPPQVAPPSGAVVVPSEGPAAPAGGHTNVCANCGSGLAGAYCAACGQKHEPHVHSLAHFAGEAFESISHADSRLWRTLWLLVSRPGRLTLEFFAGHRVSYLPPFRLYLVLSVVCFVIAGLPGDEPAAQAGMIKGPGAASEPARNAAAEGSAARKRPVVIHSNGVADFCKEFNLPDAGGGMGTRARANMRGFCLDVQEDVGALGEAVLHNLPRAMFIFLPLLAALMKLLYWSPRRYYVEHLLFLVHNHAFVFVAISVLEVLSRLPLVESIAELLGFAVFFYMIWYIYRAMRNVYRQGRALTFTKYLILGFSYALLSFISLLTTLLLSVMLH